MVDGHMALLGAGTEEPVRSRGEYAIELLTFGLLRSAYGSLAASTSPEGIARMAELWRVRSTDPDRKSAVDAERGRLFLDLLLRDGSFVGSVDIDDGRLVDWLAATGEFVEESLRMRTWMPGSGAFWSPAEFIQATDSLAEWFIHRAREVLGRWTTGVAGFRKGILEAGIAREDLFLVTREEPLYHLNMVGSEVMNRGFLPGFRSRPRKVVLVPGCMRARSDKNCQALRDGLDISCTRCHDGCEVAALDRLGEQHGFRVFVVPHASSFTAWLRHWRNDVSTALIAVACPLHLVPGGYEMRGLELEAQCILLQYSGCSRHWDPAGTPTRLDGSRLLELVLS